MSFLKQSLLSPCCIACGSFFSNASLFCTTCLGKEMSDNFDQKSSSHIANHSYLIEWNKNSESVINELVYRMKSDSSPMAWEFYAKLCYETLLKTSRFSEFRGLVPIPSSKQSSVHASLFANELSRLLELPVYDLLFKEKSSSEQKKLSAKQRGDADAFKSKEAFIEEFTKYIFVDDILTTGQSFLQSKKALNASDASLIVTLFYRPKTL